MKVAIISPISMLELSALTDYHLVLPHLVTSSEDYARFYKEVPGYKILDNGAAEGEDVSIDALHDIAHEIGIDEIVLPDTLADSQATITQAWNLRDKTQPQNFKYMGVAQGKSTAEVIKTIQAFEHYELGVTCIGLPRLLCNEIHRTIRYTLLSALPKEYPAFEWHALGGSDWIREIVALEEIYLPPRYSHPSFAGELSKFRGIDTSLPVVLGINGIGVQEDRYIDRQRDFFYRKLQRHTVEYKTCIDNVFRYLDWGGIDAGAAWKQLLDPETP